MGGRPGNAGRAAMVTQGMGGLFARIVAGAKRVVKLGQSGTKRALRELEEIVVFAKMIRVNNQPPPAPIQGFVTVTLNNARDFVVSATRSISMRVKNVYETIKITVTRLR